MKKLLILLLFPVFAYGQIQTINVGTPNSGTGDPLRTAMVKVNENFEYAMDQLALKADITYVDAQLAGKQDIDGDLTAIAGLSPSNDDIIQRKTGAWTNRTIAQLKSDLTLTKSDVGLGNVDNTSDANKPVSTATQSALDLKADLASPTFTGTPAAPTAAVGTNTTQIATTAYVQANTLSKATSTIYTSGTSYNAFQNIVGPSSNNKAIEILNIGYTGHGATDDIHENTTGLVRVNGRLNLVRNMQWDQANAKWLTPLQTASAYGSACLEIGGEAVILHATPTGVNFSDVPHEILMAKASGTDGETNHTVSSGYFVQSKATIFARFNSTAYNPATTANCWNQTAGTDPLLWLSTGETKNTENELARFEANSNTAGAYPAVFFARSHGTLGSRTIAVTGEVSGRIGFKAYDGVDYETTAAIDVYTRGTMASNSVGQEMRFLTSPSTTGNLALRMAISDDGAIKNYVPWRFDVSTITTIPNYTGNGYTPAIGSGTVAQVQPASTTNGGMIFQGFTVSGTNTATALIFRGIQGHTSPTGANTQFVALKHNGSTNFTDIGSSEIGFQFRNNATVLSEVLGNGNMGVLQTTPTAVVDLGAVTTSRASLRIRAGSTTTAPSSPNSGDIWHQGTNNRLMFRKGSSSEEIMSAVQVNSVSPTAPNRTIQITIDGTTYYIAAKTSND